MAFTPKIGTSTSQLGNIEPGQGGVEPVTQRGGPGSDQLLAYGDAFQVPALSGTGKVDPPRYTLLQKKGFASGTSLSFDNPVTTGSLIVICGDANSTVPTDNQGLGNVYTKVATVGAPGGWNGASIYYCYNVQSGGGTFTITIGQFRSTNVGIAEFGGFGTVDPFVGASAQQFGNSTGPFTKTIANAPSSDHMGVGILCIAGGIGGFTPVGTTLTTDHNPQWTTANNTSPWFYGLGFGNAGYYNLHTVKGATDSVTVQVNANANWSILLAEFQNPQDAVGTSAGTSTANAGSLAIFEGGYVLQETSDKIILEDGSGFLKLESTSEGGRGIAAGTGTATAVGSISGTISNHHRITQEGRNVPWAESAPSARLTQFARNTAWLESGALPQLRLTQMARNVLYHYQCAGEPPPPLLDSPIVHVTNLTPIWQLERFDLKHRDEDSYSAEEQSNTSPPSWVDDGSRWKLQRFDLRPRIEGTIEATPLNTANSYLLLESGSKLLYDNGDPIPLERTETQWQIARFDIHNRDEETA